MNIYIIIIFLMRAKKENKSLSSKVFKIFKVIEKYINSGFSIFEDNEDISNISCYAIKNDEKRKIFLKNNIVNIVYFENKK